MKTHNHIDWWKYCPVWLGNPIITLINKSLELSIACMNYTTTCIIIIQLYTTPDHVMQPGSLWTGVFAGRIHVCPYDSVWFQMSASGRRGSMRHCQIDFVRHSDQRLSGPGHAFLLSPKPSIAMADWRRRKLTFQCWKTGHETATCCEYNGSISLSRDPRILLSIPECCCLISLVPDRWRHSTKTNCHLAGIDRSMVSLGGQLWFSLYGCRLLHAGISMANKTENAEVSFFSREL